MKFPTLLEAIQTKPGRDRAPISRGMFARFDKDGAVESNVERDGGKFGSGLIRGVSILTRGEALGHGQWIDSEALDQSVKLSKSSKTGLKMRFTHPSMSGDGLGSFMGWAFDVYREGDQVFGDVHLSETSRNTPDGDLGAYVMDLAESDPEAFGTSIVFAHDLEAESEFMLEHGGEHGFESPDELNENNFPHVRIAALYAADFVDEPAANPNGLFHRGPTHDVLTQAEGVLEYVLGLSDQVPNETGGLSAERLKGFLNRFLDGRGMQLSVSNKEQEMKKETKLSEVAEESKAPETTDTPEASQEKPAESTETPKASEEPEGSEAKPEGFSMADLTRFTDKFGAEKGLAYFKDGKSFEEALSIEFDTLKAKSSITSGQSRGEAEPVGTFADGGKKSSTPKAVSRWAELIGGNSAN